MINDEELKRFHDWLQAKGDEPSVVLTLRWIAEFEAYLEADEEDFMEFKAWLNARDDPKAAAALRVVADFEETVEVDARLKQFHGWLAAKGNDPTAVVARWWLVEFEEAQEDDRPDSGPLPTLY